MSSCSSLFVFITIYNHFFSISHGQPHVSSTTQFVPTAVDPVTTAWNGIVQDIGCNYINLGGIGMPTEYCMTITGDGDLNYAIQWKCNDSFTGMDLNFWIGSECTEDPYYSMDYSLYLPQFVCDQKYANERCNEVSLKAYQDDADASGDCSGAYTELRLIVDECLLIQSNLYATLGCTEDSATYSIYETNNYTLCNNHTLLNSSSITEGSLEGESAGCIIVDGCSDDGGFNVDDGGINGTIIAYIVIGSVVAIAALLIGLYFARKCYERKINANIAVTHSGQAVPNPYGRVKDDPIIN